jgi:2-phosphosulfolactate phosphatase
MPQPLHVHLLPSLIEPDTLQDGTAVIIDILRASSTIITALHNGASRVIPCGTPEEAVQVKQRLAPGTVLLGGERGGVRIPGFDLGNSPAEYPPDVVTGHTVAFTTTNGTRALLAASSAERILIGAFLNRSAVVERLDQDHQPTHLICAGTDGVITGEDVLFAGAIVDGLRQRSVPDGSQDHRWILNDSAMLSLGFWKQAISASQDPNSATPGFTLEGMQAHRLTYGIQSVLKGTRGGQNLTSLGYDADILLCSQVDIISMIPQFDRQEHSLVPLAIGPAPVV